MMRSFGNNFFSGYVLRFNTPFHVSVDHKSSSSEDTSEVDEAVTKPLMETVSEEVDATTEEGTQLHIIIPRLFH